MSERDQLREALGDSLAYCAEDHSPLMWVESSVECHFPGIDRHQVCVLTAALTEALLAERLALVGLPRGGSRFAAEDLTPEEASRRVLDGWDADPLPVQVGMWLRATVHGHAVNAGLRVASVLDAARDRAAAAAAKAGYQVGG